MASVPLLFAFGFGNVLMLGWLAAAAAPILIHLWNKRKYREIPWAAMEYLVAALRKNARRVRLEQWLLLAVRTLVIALVVMAMAEPFIEQAGLKFMAGERTLKVIVIDGSYSMAYKPTDKSRFDRAKQLATQLVDDSQQGDGFALLLMGSPPTVVVGTPALERGDFQAEIEQLKLPHGGANLPATLSQVEAILATADAAKLTRKEVYFFSDLGRNTWQPDLETGPAQQEFQHKLDSLAREATLIVVDLGQSQPENLAVTGLRAAGPFATLAQEVTFEAQVRNFGSQARNHHLVELYVDGRRVREAYVDVPAGQEASLSLAHQFDAPGPHAVEVRLGPDLLDVDDHRWLSLPVREYLRVLCVNGKPASAPMTGATDYLTLALNPEEDATARGLIRPEVILESALLERDLTQYDCIFLCNVGQFTQSEARALESYLKRGGGLVFFLGDQVLAERYNRELGGQQQTRVLPALIKGLSDASSFHLDPQDYRHPLVNAFQGREQTGLLSTPVHRYFRLDLAPKSRAKAALWFRESRDPAIVEEPIHRGRSILVATDGSLSSVDPSSQRPWTLLPTWPSYLPIVRKLLALAVGGQSGERNVEVGQSLEGVVKSASSSVVKLRTPDGRVEDLRPTTDADGRRWSYAETWLSGIYTVDAAVPGSAPEPLAVNVNTAESNLTEIDPTELPPQFTTSRKVDLDEPSSDLTPRHSALHKALLYCVLGLLLLETFLAWRFGNPTR